MIPRSAKSTAVSSLAGTLHAIVLAAAERLRDTGLRDLVLRGEQERFAAEIATVWGSGFWTDMFGIERCFSCGLIVHPKVGLATERCQCPELAVAAL